VRGWAALSDKGGQKVKKKQHIFWQSVYRELRENRNTFLVYTGLRLLVIAVMILQIFNRNFENVFLCLLTLVLMVMPSILQATMKIELPSALEIIILCFIFAAEILGEISSFYVRFQYWDTILHTLNGFLCAAVGFSLVDIMNRETRLKFELSPLFMAITAFCFSMTIGVLWEFFEFGMDMLVGFDMQKDTIIHEIRSVSLDPTNSNICISTGQFQEVLIDGRDLGVGGYLDIGLIDTMYDLLVNFIGAIVFSIMGFFYIKRRDAKGLVGELVPQPWSEEKMEEVQEEEIKEDKE